MGTTTTAILVLAVIQAAMCDVSPRTFFPGVNGNLTKIVWAHAVNSKALLNQALESGNVMMLEADVVVGTNSSGNTTKEMPIMAHTPANESDLSLWDFLNTVVQKNASKGIKLDFKSIEAFNMSKPILKEFRQRLGCPVFINADILQGPVNATTKPVDATAFISGAMEVMPDSTLSLGWTTRYGEKENITEGRYTSEQMQEMLDTIKENEVKQPVTYPVRAGLVANDISVVKKLLDDSPANATLTLWSSEGDFVKADELSKLVREVGVENVYLDVPEDLKKRLNFNSGAASLGATLLVSLGPLVVTLLLSRML